MEPVAKLKNQQHSQLKNFISVYPILKKFIPDC
jgi:hypothetical protein